MTEPYPPLVADGFELMAKYPPTEPLRLNEVEPADIRPAGSTSSLLFSSVSVCHSGMFVSSTGVRRM